ncbi:MAG: hypothetical protein JJ973_19205 [Rhodospirillales bacterium]|nr:hypothetical protein [Rhodospirillales bacterium]
MIGLLLEANTTIAPFALTTAAVSTYPGAVLLKAHADQGSGDTVLIDLAPASLFHAERMFHDLGDGHVIEGLGPGPTIGVAFAVSVLHPLDGVQQIKPDGIVPGIALITVGLLFGGERLQVMPPSGYLQGRSTPDW